MERIDVHNRTGQSSANLGPGPIKIILAPSENFPKFPLSIFQHFIYYTPSRLEKSGKCSEVYTIVGVEQKQYK